MNTSQKKRLRDGGERQVNSRGIHEDGPPLVVQYTAEVQTLQEVDNRDVVRVEGTVKQGQSRDK